MYYFAQPRQNKILVVQTLYSIFGHVVSIQGKSEWPGTKIICVMPMCVMPACVTPACVIPVCVMPFCVMPVCVILFAFCLLAWYLFVWCLFALCFLRFASSRYASLRNACLRDASAWYLFAWCLLRFCLLAFCFFALWVFTESACYHATLDWCIHDLDDFISTKTIIFLEGRGGMKNIEKKLFVGLKRQNRLVGKQPNL